MDPFTIGIIVTVVVALGWLLMTYNGLVSLRNRVKEAWSQIDVQLKRRASLIPNLVESVKGYAKHEKEVFENVTKARSALMGASENFKQLQDEISDTETKVAASRQFYNTNVLDLNNTLEMFPSSLVGSMFGFQKEEFFKATEEDKKDIQVKF